MRRKMKTLILILGALLVCALLSGCTMRHEVIEFLENGGVKYSSHELYEEGGIERNQGATPEEYFDVESRDELSHEVYGGMDYYAKPTTLQEEEFGSVDDFVSVMNSESYNTGITAEEAEDGTIELSITVPTAQQIMPGTTEDTTQEDLDTCVNIIDLKLPGDGWVMEADIPEGHGAYLKFTGREPNSFRLTLPGGEENYDVSLTIALDGRGTPIESVDLLTPSLYSGLSIADARRQFDTVCENPGIDEGGMLITWFMRDKSESGDAVWTQMGEDGVLAAQAEYKVVVTIPANPGFRFAEGADVLLNGSDSGFSYERSSRTVCIEAELGGCGSGLVGKVEITLGDISKDADVRALLAAVAVHGSDDDAFRSTSCFATLDGNSLTFGDKLIPGQEYGINVHTEIRDGYYLDPEKTTVTFNGEELSGWEFIEAVPDMAPALFDASMLFVYGDAAPGDVNMDGEVDAKDLTALARHIAGIETFAEDSQNLANADVTGDGDVSAPDLTKLARIVANIE